MNGRPWTLTLPAGPLRVPGIRASAGDDPETEALIAAIFGTTFATNSAEARALGW